MIGEGQGTSLIVPSPRRLEHQKAANSATGQPTAIKLSCEANGETIVVVGSVVFGSFDKDKKDVAASLEGHPQESIGTYSASLDESFIMEKMSNFGLQPWTIKVVTAQLPRPMSFPIVNRVPSIQVEVIGQDRLGVKVALRNLSALGVTAFMVANSFRDPNTRYTEGNFTGVAIASGASHEIHFPCDASGNEPTNADVASSSPCTFVLEAALFSDGSYEGDAAAAAQLEIERDAAAKRNAVTGH
jgi:hypothetical protein